MAWATLRREERIALIVAVAAHLGVLAVLVLRPAPPPPPPPVRMSVTLSDATGPTETAPRQAPANADLAPTLGTAAPQRALAPAPTPVVKPAPVHAVPVPVPPPPRPHPVAAPRPAPPPPTHTAKARPPEPTPRPKPEVRPERHAAPDSDPIARAIAAAHDQPRPAKPAKPAHTATQSFAEAFGNAPAKPKGPVGGNRIGADFLKGLSAANTTSRSNGAPAKSIGADARAALSGAIARQLKPHWVAPQGVDADKLVTILAFDLNPDGSLAGKPQVVSQQGINDSNRPQAARHAEQAIRAVELAAPFTLPAEYYSLWHHIPSARFDRNLSQ